MLSDQEFEDWCRRLCLTETTKEFVQKIRCSEPVRIVGGGAKNVCGSYPSRKMGKTIQFESHKVELPAIVEYENDEDVLEYYDQPIRLSLSFKSKSGRCVVTSHTPDFLIIRRNCVGFEEWKPSERLKTLAQKQPTRYQQSEDGQWHAPPAETKVQPLLLYYHLRTDQEINWIAYRNHQFLKAYFNQENTVNSEVRTTVVECVRANPGMTLKELLESTSTNWVDDIYALIATKQLYVDLKAVALSEPEQVHLFSSQQMALAYSVMIAQRISTTIASGQRIDVAVGSTLIWDGKSWCVLQIGDTKIALQSENELIQLTHANFDALIAQKEITHIQPKSAKTTEIWEQLKCASPEDLSVANYRYKIIEPYLHGRPPINSSVPERTIRSWKSRFNKALNNYGWGYIGLLPNRGDKGNRVDRFSPDTWEFIDRIIEQHYENLKQRGKLATYGILVREWEKAGRTDPCPSRITFCKRINQRDPVRQTRQRQGSRAAYQKNPFYHELTLSTPNHGSRPFEICHIDHTELDIELVCSRTGRCLGRPWATILIDAFSRRIFAIYLTFDPPSYRSCMMVLRICVQRLGRFPETLIMDNGVEFGSIYFETLLAAFACTKKQRPVASPRFGSLIERFFGTTNTEFFYNLKGNTQITKQVRLVNKANNPKVQAVWTLPELYEYFCEYAYVIYDCREHPALGLSPNAAFERGLNQSGMRYGEKILDDENFKIFTLPSTPKGSAKIIPRIGIKINSIYYWSIDDSFLNPEVEGTQVPVRYDPFDVGTAYAYVKGNWVRCISEYYSSLQGHSEREIRLASIELRQQKNQYNQKITIRAKELAQYLESAEAQETLQAQRLHDLAALDMRQLLYQNNIKQTKTYLDEYPININTTNPTEVLSQTDKLNIPAIDLEKIQPHTQEELWQ
ncbi:TnsA endonuclease N-terminal domain-containing protein [Nostoc sp. LEGE 12450]|uniref:TnsA endonuclease N-terminal domain-containing protein n=1 Tax=Nostoc sp. LEGE 12450 TaxID=1828643 RepID=UPI00187FCCFF|nr:TnsA endonuclease N-terminal domain-containing protein [Nostoc sp. LEGE 12450]MBE8989982.1 DDE-type integrase/transposase/recombinase [Nostoc sp. LEGE 12450]